MKGTAGGFLGEAIMDEVRKGTQQGIREGISTNTLYTSSDDIMEDVEKILVNGVTMIGVKLLSSLLHL